MPDYRLHWYDPGTSDGRLLMQGLNQYAFGWVLSTQCAMRGPRAGLLRVMRYQVARGAAGGQCLFRVSGFQGGPRSGDNAL